MPSIRDSLSKNSSSCSTVLRHFCAVSGTRIRIATYTHRMRNRRRVSCCASPTSSHAPCCANQKTSSASAPKPSSVVLRAIVLQRGCQNEDNKIQRPSTQAQRSKQSRRPRKALWTRHQRVGHPLAHFNQQRTDQQVDSKLGISSV